MNKKLTAWALLALAVFMFFGFLSSGAAWTSVSALGALVISVVLPAVGGVLLLKSDRDERARLGGRKEQLRLQTYKAEMLRLAERHGGKLTAVEAAMALSISPEAAKEVLDAMHLDSQAELEITDDGVLVYSFYDLRHLGGKNTSRGVLDA